MLMGGLSLFFSFLCYFGFSENVIGQVHFHNHCVPTSCRSRPRSFRARATCPRRRPGHVHRLCTTNPVNQIFVSETFPNPSKFSVSGTGPISSVSQLSLYSYLQRNLWTRKLRIYRIISEPRRIIVMIVMNIKIVLAQAKTHWYRKRKTPS